MSVPESERGTSGMEFIKGARELQIVTLRNIKKFPKSWTFNITNKIYALSFEVYDEVMKGNSIYPMNVHEVQLRRDHMLSAMSALKSLVSQIELAAEAVNLESDVMFRWSEAIHKEIGYLKGTIEKDRKRYDEIFHCDTLRYFDHNNGGNLKT